MAASRIAIVGSADPTRKDYNPEVYVEDAKSIAGALGAELAKRGPSIIRHYRG
jgi:hypothetical protein